MTLTIRLAAPVLGTPDPGGLARFHQRLPGWPIRDDEPAQATPRPEDGGYADPAGHPFCSFTRT